MKALPQLTEAFQTARLQYLKPDREDPAFRTFIAQALLDTDIQGKLGIQQVQPYTENDVDGFIDKITNSLLGVAICLQPGQEFHDQRPGGATVAGEPLTAMESIIGFLYVCVPPADPFGLGIYRNGKITMALAPGYRSNGYGSEALAWALKWSFDRADLHTLHASIPSYNNTALRLFHRLGFTVEGWRKQVIFQDGQFLDIVEYGITVRAWLHDKKRESPRSPINIDRSENN
jgi:RimJ/RimL family protein N-acetyltransferase